MVETPVRENGRPANYYHILWSVLGSWFGSAIGCSAWLVRLAVVFFRAGDRHDAFVAAIGAGLDLALPVPFILLISRGRIQVGRAFLSYLITITFVAGLAIVVFQHDGASAQSFFPHSLIIGVVCAQSLLIVLIAVLQEAFNRNATNLHLSLLGGTSPSQQPSH